MLSIAMHKKITFVDQSSIYSAAATASSIPAMPPMAGTAIPAAIWLLDEELGAGVLLLGFADCVVGFGGVLPTVVVVESVPTVPALEPWPIRPEPVLLSSL